MVINVGHEFRDRISIPSVCQITDVKIEQVVQFIPRATFLSSS